ncbi:MAG: VOC family protein [Burkholderiaceae bacterium]|nr:VOC family protein [Burkholderiaceae bacterium]
MFSHVFVGVSDFDRAYGFYAALMGSLGIGLRFCEPANAWAGWHSADRVRPLFVIGKPHDGQAHHPGNGQMTAFLAADRETVHKAYQTALDHGGRCEGPPGLRPHYHADYYGAYFRDTEGNKVCVACHTSVKENDL